MLADLASKPVARKRERSSHRAFTESAQYGIGVGRGGFTWSGVKTIERKSEWPDWLPPADMLQQQPYLPRFMAGGPGNPLGARAMYLSGAVAPIHLRLPEAFFSCRWETKMGGVRRSIAR